MEKIILDGNVIAQEIRDGLKTRIDALKNNGIIPCLATILVGDNSASETYVRMKVPSCAFARRNKYIRVGRSN